jgi:hypothetical protein
LLGLSWSLTRTNHRAAYLCHNCRIGVPPLRFLHCLKARLRWMQTGACAVENAMIAAKKSYGKTNAELFDDVPVLRRKWQAAKRPGQSLPRYEDVMLGSLGKLADHIVLLRSNDKTLEVSRTGRYVQKWLDDDR